MAAMGFMMSVFFWNTPVKAQSPLIQDLEDSPGAPLQITADKLLADRQSQYLLFSGNVVAVYSGKTIHADKLKVTYLDTPQTSSGLGQGKIDKIIATGHVTIQFENKTAYCDQATYTQNTQTIVLTGKEAKIQSDDNYITGEKITVNQQTGQVIVDGNAQQRVNAVFIPESASSPSGGKKGDDVAP